MPDDVRLKYLDLIKLEKDARMRFAGMQKMISEVSQALTSFPFEFAFSNIGVKTPYPVSSKRMVDGRMWPNAEQLQQALVKWFEAREEAVKVWTRLSEQDRQGLTPPVGYRG